MFKTFTLLLSVFFTTTVGELHSIWPEKNETGQSLEFDFGTVIKNKEVSKVIKVYNNSRQTVRIKSVCTPCYCTVPVWSKKPIEPGKAGLIKVMYNGEETGPFQEKIKILYYNPEKLDKNDLINRIILKGSVIED